WCDDRKPRAVTSSPGGAPRTGATAWTWADRASARPSSRGRDRATKSGDVRRVVTDGLDGLDRRGPYAASVDGLFDDEDLSPRPAVPGSGTLQASTHASAPLAVRMRPRTLDELVGQSQLRAEGSPLRRLVEGDPSMSLLVWGPPGPGQTT